MPTSSNHDEPPQRPGAFKPPSVEELSALIPAYEFLEFIDRGGMGAVYRARQRSLDRIVAVKLLPMGLRNRRAFTERFSREAKALALLNHPHIVSVYDFGETECGCMYYVMEYVKGTTLRNLMKQGKATSRQLLSIAAKVCEALQFAHSHGVVHRDVKPANILMDDRGHVKVADFGLAKVLGPAPDRVLTAPSDTLGTPDYMAPEACSGEHEVDHRADIYSLGVMLYEMLTGHVPKGVWEPPSRTSGADVRFDEVISRALQADPGRRYQTVTDLSTAMSQVVQATSTQALTPALDRVPPPAPPVDPKASTVALGANPARSRMPASAVAVLSLAVLGGAGFSLVRSQPTVRQFLGLAPVSSPLATTEMPPATEMERQRALAKLVFAHGGFVNVTTPFRSDRIMGDESDIHDEAGLPKGDFTIWRVSVSDQTKFNDEDLAGLIRACEVADSVSNLNLYSCGVTDAGMQHLPRLSSTLTSLNLRNTNAFTQRSLPFLAACKLLRAVFVSTDFTEPGNSGTDSVADLAMKLRELLPECEVRVE